MNSIPRFLLPVLALLAGSASATPVATARTYSLNGNRNDIAVSAIQVTTDGTTWTTLPNSSFCSGKSNGNAVVMNSITPALDYSTHFRMVQYADEIGHPLATGITGLRIVFPEQELGYTCFWEIEAERFAPVEFLVKNTVNGNTEVMMSIAYDLEKITNQSKGVVNDMMHEAGLDIELAQ